MTVDVFILIIAEILSMYVLTENEHFETKWSDETNRIGYVVDWNLS